MRFLSCIQNSRKQIFFFITCIFTSIYALSQNLVVSGGALHSILLCGNGNVYTTGFNSDGQLGTGTIGTPAYSTGFVQVLRGAGPSTDGVHLTSIRQVDSRSTNHNIALDCNGFVYTWGMNNHGQLGNNSTTSSALPVRVLTGAQGHASGFLTNVTQICGGDGASYAVLSNGEVMGWGENANGQLGDNTTTPKLIPVYVLKTGGSRLNNVVQIRAGDDFCAALCSDGTVWTWGRNTNAQLGQNNTTQYNIATQVFLDAARTQPLTNIQKITTGDTHMLALATDGTLYSWGGNWSGQLGQAVAGAGASCPLPQKVLVSAGGAELTGVVGISAGNRHSIAVTSSGAVYAWGGTGAGNYYGQDGLASAQAYPTTAVSGISNVIDVSVGDLWSFVLTSSGQLYGFGQNGTTGGGGPTAYGFLGLGSMTTTFNSPQLITLPCGLGRACPKANLGPNVTLCNPMSASLYAGSNDPNYTYVWKLNNNVIAGATSSTYTAVTAGTYKVVISDPTNPSPCGCLADSATVVISSAANATPNNPVYCTLPTSLNFCVTGPSGTNYDWYDAPTGGNKVNVTPSNCYTTTVNSAPAVFYAQDLATYQYNTGYAVNAANLSSAQSDYFTTHGTVAETFNVIAPVTLNEVTVHFLSVPGGCAGSFTMNVSLFQNGAALSTVTYPVRSVAIPCSPTSGTATFTINWNIPVGNNYSLRLSGAGNNVRTYRAGASYPLGVSGIFHLTGVEGTTSSYCQACYGAFYDWKITAGNSCSRVPVQAIQNCITPVELIDFNGFAYKNYNVLNWSTAKERNSSHFILEKSIDGINFSYVDKIAGNKNANHLIKYSYIDHNSNEPLTYYRLIQVDYDGASTVFPVITVSRENEFVIKVFPNPFEGFTKVYINQADTDGTYIQVIDIAGKTVHSEIVTESGIYYVGNELPPGIYYLHVRNKHQTESTKIVKVN
ncbi:MAG: T9SS type A sorting domain-containing protein [Cytophagaceae bacterium]